MTEENGATVVLPGSHRIRTSRWWTRIATSPPENLPKELEKHTVICGSLARPSCSMSITFMAVDPIARQIPRRNVIGIWAGPDTYPVTVWFAYDGIYPVSQDPCDSVRRE